MTAPEFDPALVEKAARVLLEASFPLYRRVTWNELSAHGRERHLTKARAALSAVADDLRAEAWDEGFDSALSVRAQDGVRWRVDNPYRREEVTK